MAVNRTDVADEGHAGLNLLIVRVHVPGNDLSARIASILQSVMQGRDSVGGCLVKFGGLGGAVAAKFVPFESVLGVCDLLHERCDLFTRKCLVLMWLLPAGQRILRVREHLRGVLVGGAEHLLAALRDCLGRHPPPTPTLLPVPLHRHELLQEASTFRELLHTALEPAVQVAGVGAVLVGRIILGEVRHVVGAECVLVGFLSVVPPELREGLGTGQG